MMNILCIGDIFARPGREILRARLPHLIDEHHADFVIVNVENSAGGRGITPKLADELAQLPIDVMTSGNHIWQHDAIVGHLRAGKILRPANAPVDRAGSGVATVCARNGAMVGVVNLQGRINMYEGDKHANPFRTADLLIPELRKKTPIIIVDLHAEVTAEKKAFGYYVDGRVTCVYGTHTHVQTADEQILPHGTAYITDLGMTGPHASVIGVRPEDAIKRFLSDGEEKHWKPADSGVQLQGIVLAVDTASGQANTIQRFSVK